MRENVIDWVIYAGLGYLPKHFDDKMVHCLLVDTIMRTLEHFDAQACALSPQGWEKYGEYAEETWMEHPLSLVRLRGENEHWYFFWYLWSD